MSISLLNRRTAPQIVSLCAMCFKQGVLDAYEQGDDYAAKEFLDQHKAGWTYGVLGEPDDYDWKMWRFSLYRWCRHHGLARFAEEYLYEVKKFNYAFCPIVLSMRFYLMGIEEWLAYPNPVGIERFRRETMVHWKIEPGTVRKFSRKSIIIEMQSMAYQYRRRPESDWEVSGGVMVEFGTAMVALTSKLVYNKRLKIGDESIQNT